jgi:hypothetical protein
MNEPTKLMLMMMAAATAISGIKASSISLQEPAALSGNPTFSLTVENGKPSGHYEAGTQVVVSATEPPPRVPVCSPRGAWPFRVETPFGE